MPSENTEINITLRWKYNNNLKTIIFLVTKIKNTKDFVALQMHAVFNLKVTRIYLARTSFAQILPILILTYIVIKSSEFTSLKGLCVCSDYFSIHSTVGSLCYGDCHLAWHHTKLG